MSHHPYLLCLQKHPQLIKVFERVFNVGPEPIVTVLPLLAELVPNVAALCPTVTCPPTSVLFGTIFVTVLKTWEPSVLFPKVGPVIVSVTEFPAISVPVTVKLVDDKSPPSERIVIVPFKEECEIGVPSEEPDVTDAFEKSESLSVEAPLNHWPKSIVIVPDPVELVGKLKPENSSVCEVARLVMLRSEEKVFADDGDDIVKDDAVVLVVDVTSFVYF